MNDSPAKGRRLDGALLEKLLVRCAARDARALDELYRAAAPALLGCLMHMLHRRDLAEDVLQEVFIAVWQRADRFDELRGRADAWLYSIARYKAIDELRRRRSGGGSHEELDEQTPGPDALRADTGIEFSALESSLGRCLELLGATQRRCVTLAFVDGYSHDEIARTVQSPLGTVKSWVRRGLTSLRDCLSSAPAA